MATVFHTTFKITDVPSTGGDASLVGAGADGESQRSMYLRNDQESNKDTGAEVQVDEESMRDPDLNDELLGLVIEEEEEVKNLFEIQDGRVGIRLSELDKVFKQKEEDIHRCFSALEKFLQELNVYEDTRILYGIASDYNESSKLAEEVIYSALHGRDREEDKETTQPANLQQDIEESLIDLSGEVVLPSEVIELSLFDLKDIQEEDKETTQPANLQQDIDNYLLELKNGEEIVLLGNVDDDIDQFLFSLKDNNEASWSEDLRQNLGDCLKALAVRANLVQWAENVLSQKNIVIIHDINPSDAFISKMVARNVEMHKIMLDEKAVAKAGNLKAPLAQMQAKSQKRVSELEDELDQQWAFIDQLEDELDQQWAFVEQLQKAYQVRVNKLEAVEQLQKANQAGAGELGVQLAQIKAGYQERVQELEAAYRQHAQELRATLAREQIANQTRVGKLDVQLAQIQVRYQERVNELEAELVQRQTRIDELQTKLAQTQEHLDGRDTLVTRYRARVDELEITSAQRQTLIDELKAELEQVQDEGQGREQVLRTALAQERANVDALQAELEQAQKSAGELEAALEQVQKDRDEHIQKLREAHEKTVNAMENEIRKQKEDIRDLEEGINTIQEQLNRATKGSENQTGEAEINKLREQLAQAQAQHKEALAQAKAQRQKRIDDLLAAHQDALAKAQAEYETKLAQAQTARQQRINELLAAHQDALAQAQAAHQAQMEALNGKLAQTRARVGELEEQAAQADAQRPERDELLAARQDALAQAQTEYETKLAQAQAAHQASVEELNRELEQARARIGELQNQSAQEPGDYQAGVSALQEKLKQMQLRDRNNLMLVSLIGAFGVAGTIFGAVEATRK